jgi:peroxiredoxin
MMMRIIRVLLALALIVGAPTAILAQANTAPEKAICPVCKVMEGVTEAEPVKAERTYDGKVYVFCSEKCAKAFEADPVAYVPPELPRPAPEFALRGLGGQLLSNESLKGKVVLLDFWATWCVPCRKSMPELQALHQKFAQRGFVVVGISIDENGLTRVQKFVKARKISYPIALDTEDDPAWGAFRVKAVPAAYLLDRKGRIVAQWTGKSPATIELETKLESLLTAM